MHSIFLRLINISCTFLNDFLKTSYYYIYLKENLTYVIKCLSNINVFKKSLFQLKVLHYLTNSNATDQCNDISTLETFFFTK